MKAWIPNLITLLNLFCGCAAIICLLDYQFMNVFYLLVLAGVFDFADGLVARALNVSSEHGKELDSLSDMVSFGVVPGMIYYVLLFIGGLDETVYESLAPASPPAISWSWLAAPGLILVLFSALRLAKFNLDTRQTENFMGVATPTSTVFAAGVMLIATQNLLGLGDFFLNPVFLYGCVVVMSYLLVSEHPMFSFKLKGFGWAGNETRYIFAALAIGLLIFLQLAAFPFIVAVYLILNLAAPPTTRTP